MLLTVSVQGENAENLGFLLHKHPEQFQTFEFSYGNCHVFYPEAERDRCTVALLLEIDPIKLVRGGKSRKDAPLAQYVNDRPYVASSLMSVAIGKVFRTAMNGQCKAKPELPDEKFSIEAEVSATPVRGGEAILERLFEPLGYEVVASSY